MTFPGAVPPVDVLRGLGMLSLTLLMMLRFIPALRARQRALSLWIGGAYVVLGLLVYLVGYVI